MVLSALGKYSGQAMQLAKIVVIARLLTPEEFGVYALAAALVLVVSELKSFGVGHQFD